MMRQRMCVYTAVLERIRRIRMFLGHPDPLFRGIDPEPSISHIGVERTEIMLAKLNFNLNFSKKDLR
jgi:hypothetical protein